ncbi:MAG: hypothetical protein GXO43_03975 [Crenarchaeota archaeon]|nr:hypothetical protein [Thermoproteota archaeon]
MVQYKFFKTVLPILFTIAGCISIWVSELVFSDRVLYVTLASHIVLVILAFLGIILTRLSFREAGVISPNLQYSLYWGFYLSLSVCLPAIAFAFFLHELGYASLRIENLTIYTLLTTLFTSLALGGLCEELFFSRICAKFFK